MDLHDFQAGIEPRQLVQAMASHRPYRPSLGINKVVEEIKKNKGLLYDPKIVNTCIKILFEKKFKFEDLK